MVINEKNGNVASEEKQAKIDIINASWVRVRDTKLVIVKIEAQLAAARIVAARLFEEHKMAVNSSAV